VDDARVESLVRIAHAVSAVYANEERTWERLSDDEKNAWREAIRAVIEEYQRQLTHKSETPPAFAPTGVRSLPASGPQDASGRT
jgi:hypothetical protein